MRVAQGDTGEDYDDDEERPGDNEEVDAEDGGEAEEDIKEDKRHRECIYVPGIDDFHYIDDKHLTVSTSPRRIYLVTLWNRCFDLRWSHTIAIKAYSSWTCSHSRDYVITEEHRCVIDDIERVDSIDEAERLVEERVEEDSD